MRKELVLRCRKSAVWFLALNFAIWAFLRMVFVISDRCLKKAIRTSLRYWPNHLSSQKIGNKL